MYHFKEAHIKVTLEWLKKKRKIVEEPTKEQEMSIFVDTECQVDKKVIFTWNSLFQAFKDKEFQVLL